LEKAFSSIHSESETEKFVLIGHFEIQSYDNISVRWSPTNIGVLVHSLGSKIGACLFSCTLMCDSSLTLLGSFLL
jgi:hypothetical protein